MAQIFHQSFNTISRVSLLGAMVLPLGAIMAGSAITRSSYNTKVNVPLPQPVPFSHQHHASELGIDCRYCHTSVEKSANAGVPPTQTCMSCHSQIWTNSPLLEPVRASYRTDMPIKSPDDGTDGWNRVNSVPEFVYFNHSIHINKGIGCNECHGPVNKMHLTYKSQAFFMAWCLNCHRNVEQFIRPKDEVFNLDYMHPANQIEKGEALVQQYHVNKEQLTDCWICHR